MALNPSNKKRKANGLCGNIPRAILNAVPKNCSKIPFSDLVSGENYENRAVIGKINHLYPVGQRMGGYIRKILITDAHPESDDNDKKLSVFLLDKFAKESESAAVEGFVIMTNFIVEKLTHHTANDMPVQILMKNEESKIWFGREINLKEKKTSDSSDPPKLRKSPRNKPKSSNVESQELVKKRKSPRKKLSVSDEEESHAVVSHHYEYTKLGDLVESEDKLVYNVYGIVDKCDLRITSGKRVQALHLLLTDQTETSFPCVVFAAPGEIYPDVYPGDIMRIHRMQVYKFRGRLRGRCPTPKFILVFSKDNEGDKPRTVAKTFTFTPEDIARFRELLEWNKAKNCPKLICEIRKDDYANFVCQVIGVYIAKNTDTVILKVWDGTKTKEFPGTHWGMKEEKLDQTLFTVARDFYIVLFVYGHHTTVAGELLPGQYIEVCDAHLYSPRDSPDDLKLCLHAGNKEGRGITVLKDSDCNLISLKERIDKVISDTLAIGSQTDDLLSQNNSIFLNFDISNFTSSQTSDNKEVPACNGLDTVEEPVDHTASSNAVHSGEVPAAHSNEDIAALNDPLPKHDASTQNEVVSVVDISIKPGQSTQEFGIGMPRDETIPDGENRLSTTSEPDPMCNLTPLQTRYFFHDPLQLSSQISSSIFPTHSKDSEDEWWNSVSAVSVTDGHTDVKPTSLAEIIQHSVPYKFRVLAAALGFKPDTTSIQKFVHLCCPKCFYISEDACPSFEPFETREGLSYYFCPECSKKEADKEQQPVLEYTFIISFSLHDGTGPPSIEAYLWKENAVKFFKGVTPEEALRDSATADSILHMLWSICPNCRPFNSTTLETTSVYPILDCCILSYTAANETRYQMFDTVLI